MATASVTFPNLRKRACNSSLVVPSASRPTNIFVDILTPTTAWRSTQYHITVQDTKQCKKLTRTTCRQMPLLRCKACNHSICNDQFWPYTGTHFVLVSVTLLVKCRNIEWEGKMWNDECTEYTSAQNMWLVTLKENVTTLSVVKFRVMWSKMFI